MQLNHNSANPKGVLATVGHIKETIFFLIFLINCRHHSRCNKKPIPQIIKLKRKGVQIWKQNSDYLTSGW